MMPDILKSGAPLPPMNDWALRDLLKFNNVEILTNTQIEEITEDSAIVRTENGTKEIKTDKVVFAVGFRKEDSLYNEILFDIDEIYNIGDSSTVKNIRAAIWDAYEVARNI